ncbi:hypothetical protein DL96DRAFT_1196110 [Flagelloscypha sp. PMI_526]|nr:hypothetical protein DL96DRAFT_1196110 [Flagelloscypha sp. PMI_526]
MPTSFIEWLPPEILTEVTRLAACTKGGLPTAALNFTSCSRYLHDNLAPSSIFRRTVPLFDSKGIVQKASLTNPGLWASIFVDNFSSSAVRRRSFNPSFAGWSLQLISYCRTLQFLREMQHSDYDFSMHEDIVHEECLPSIHVMLLECDGKNICQLEWAGAYQYSLRWLRQYLYPSHSRSEWPRDDRCSNCVADHIHQEPRAEAIQLQDMLFRFCFCPWKVRGDLAIPARCLCYL